MPNKRRILFQHRLLGRAAIGIAALSANLRACLDLKRHKVAEQGIPGPPRSGLGPAAGGVPWGLPA